MPYRSEKILIAGTVNDKRRKLSEEQKQAIVLLRQNGYSLRKIALMFGCSKSLVQYILNPKVKSKPKKRSTAYWTEAKKKYRSRKQELFKTGQIDENRKRKHRVTGKPP